MKCLFCIILAILLHHEEEFSQLPELSETREAMCVVWRCLYERVEFVSKDVGPLLVLTLSCVTLVLAQPVIRPLSLGVITIKKKDVTYCRGSEKNPMKHCVWIQQLPQVSTVLQVLTSSSRRALGKSLNPSATRFLLYKENSNSSEGKVMIFLDCHVSPLRNILYTIKFTRCENVSLVQQVTKLF